jgi:hypothetical protein
MSFLWYTVVNRWPLHVIAKVAVKLLCISSGLIVRDHTPKHRALWQEYVFTILHRYKVLVWMVIVYFNITEQRMAAPPGSRSRAYPLGSMMLLTSCLF